MMVEETGSRIRQNSAMSLQNFWRNRLHWLIGSERERTEANRSERIFKVSILRLHWESVVEKDGPMERAELLKLTTLELW